MKSTITESTPKKPMNCKKGLRLLVDHRETDSGENRRLKLKKITLDVLSLVLACLGLVKAVLAIKHQLDDANTLDLVIASLSIVDFIGRQNLLAIGLIGGKEAPAGSLRADWEIMSMYGTIGAISVLLGLLKAVTAQIDHTRASNTIDIANASISISCPCLLLYHRFRSEFKFDPYWRQHLSTSFLIIVTAVLLFFWSILKDYPEPFFIWNLGKYSNLGDSLTFEVDKSVLLAPDLQSQSRHCSPSPSPSLLTKEA